MLLIVKNKAGLGLSFKKFITRAKKNSMSYIFLLVAVVSADPRLGWPVTLSFSLISLNSLGHHSRIALAIFLQLVVAVSAPSAT